ncbi:MAG: hypothetical protein ABJL54_07285 [Halioglobus sp.]
MGNNTPSNPAELKRCPAALLALALLAGCDGVKFTRDDSAALHAEKAH